jgi:putative addiction module component (TIGR02574 family)
MNSKLRENPVEERISPVTDSWERVAIDREGLPVTSEQKSERDRRLDTYEEAKHGGRLASDVIDDLRRGLWPEG